MVTITRCDLNKPGYAVPQSAHALADFAYKHTDIFNTWKEDSNSLVCLSAKSEDHLISLYNKFAELTPCVKFFEPDVNEYTSICIYGTPDIRKKLSSLPLIK